MRQVLAMIAAVFAAMGTWLLKCVLEGGRWVSRMVRGEPEPIPAPVAAAAVEPVQVDDYNAVSRLAKSILSGSEPALDDLKAVPEATVQWLGVLDRNGLAKVALADAQTLRGHIRGGQPMRGIVPHDPQAVADIGRSRRAPEAVERRQRTRRDVLEAAGMMIPA